MNPTDLFKSLEAEGVGVSLNLKVTADKKPSDETRALIGENRDDLITLLALRHISGSDYHLNISTSSGKNYVMAKPHHIDEAVRLYPWGVVYDSKSRLVTTWGEVPTSALRGKRDLLTAEPLIREVEAA